MSAEAAGIVLGVLGFVVSVGGLWVSALIYKRQKQQADEHNEQQRATLGDIVASSDVLRTNLDMMSQDLSTRAAGEFPENLDAVTETVQSAVKTGQRLMIVTDVVGYGHFSNRQGFVKYREALFSAANRGVKIEMICYGGSRSMVERRKQFLGPTHSAEGAFLDERRKALWSAFAQANGYREDLTEAEIMRALHHRDWLNRRTLVEDFNVQLWEVTSTEQSMPLLFWLVPGSRAVFSLFTTGKVSKDVSFRTTSSDITAMLASIFEQLRDGPGVRRFDAGLEVPDVTGLLEMVPPPAPSAPALLAQPS